eukprot:gene41836-51857_t
MQQKVEEAEVHIPQTKQEIKAFRDKKGEILDKRQNAQTRSAEKFWENEMEKHLATWPGRRYTFSTTEPILANQTVSTKVLRLWNRLKEKGFSKEAWQEDRETWADLDNLMVGETREQADERFEAAIEYIIAGDYAHAILLTFGLDMLENERTERSEKEYRDKLAQKKRDEEIAKELQKQENLMQPQAQETEFTDVVKTKKRSQSQDSHASNKSEHTPESVHSKHSKDGDNKSVHSEHSGDRDKTPAGKGSVKSEGESDTGSTTSSLARRRPRRSPEDEGEEPPGESDEQRRNRERRTEAASKSDESEKNQKKKKGGIPSWWKGPAEHYIEGYTSWTAKQKEDFKKQKAEEKNSLKYKNESFEQREKERIA